MSCYLSRTVTFDCQLFNNKFKKFIFFDFIYIFLYLVFIWYDLFLVRHNRRPLLDIKSFIPPKNQCDE